MINRRRFLTSSVGVVALGATGFYVATDDSGAQAPATPEATTVPRAATATVTAGDLSTTREFRASVSFGDAWPLGIGAQGTVTGSSESGTVVDAGGELVRVDERPVFLALGSMPMYRTLEKVDTRQRDENNKRLRLLEGLDVTQLQQFLVATGHATSEELEVDGVFGGSTEKAVKTWQEAVGLAATGRVDTAQLVFSPGPVRVENTLRVGSPFTSLEVTEASARVLVDTSNRDRSVLAPGTDITVVAPGGERIAGSTTKQEQVVGADGSAVWRTTVAADAALPTGISSATIEVVDVAAADATLVPASALLALAEGGFAVELVEDGGNRLVRVELDEVLDGRAAVTGDLEAGDVVVVPS